MGTHATSLPKIHARLSVAMSETEGKAGKRVKCLVEDKKAASQRNKEVGNPGKEREVGACPSRRRVWEGEYLAKTVQCRNGKRRRWCLPGTLITIPKPCSHIEQTPGNAGMIRDAVVE
jgi:hypothetical protein